MRVRGSRSQRSARCGPTPGGSALAWLLLAGATVAAPAGAGDIYRCTGADGKTVFTSDRAACPNAKPHVLKARVQNVVEAGGSASATRGSGPAGPAAHGPAAPDGVEQMWRRKRADSEQQLHQVERQLSQAQSMAKGCNRGGEWYRADESGIRQHVSCDEVKSRLRKLEQQRSDLQEYLRSGIEEECRRASCLPGWIR